MSPWALALASWDTELAVLPAGLPSRPDRDADGVSGGEFKPDCGGEGRGDGAADGAAEPAGICRGNLV